MKAFDYVGQVYGTEDLGKLLAGERGRCAEALEQRIQGIVDEFGSYDPSTGVTEVPCEAANTEIEFYEAAAQIIRDTGAAP